MRIGGERADDGDGDAAAVRSASRRAAPCSRPSRPSLLPARPRPSVHASTSTLSETPLSRQRRVGAKHALRRSPTPRRLRAAARPSASARARCARASRWNAVHSGGRHARSQASAASSAPPAKNAATTDAGEHERCAARHATDARRRAAAISAAKRRAREFRKEDADGGAAQKTDGRDRRDVTHARGACKYVTGHARKGHRGYKGHKGQSRRGLAFVASETLCVLGARARNYCEPLDLFR